MKSTPILHYTYEIEKISQHLIQLSSMTQLVKEMLVIDTDKNPYVRGLYRMSLYLKNGQIFDLCCN